MAGTIFGIPFDEELFMQMWNEAPDPYLTAMIESGAVVEDPVIAERIANSGNFTPFRFITLLMEKIRIMMVRLTSQWKK